ncbi:MAG: hypothetical protein P8H59_01710 [Flavobacteriales bacterium]|nr:hypothetical protein [Flavobacteriales bacterium]MDG1779639.1 hypothetical protein [Flavobacteriales bacterium]MDG2245544.1 hypothetical protein [Flavobacteriales bacterium]
MEIEKVIKVHKTVERFWLLMFIIAVCITGWWWYNEGLEEHKFAPLLPFIALAWFLVRRFMRKRLEKQVANGEFGEQ